MSRLIQFTEFGPPEVLACIDRPTPVAGPGEVLVRVQAIGVSWYDVLWRQNLAPEQAVPPAGLGCELAGVVTALGEGVADLAVGDRVASFLGHDINRYPAYGDDLVYPATSLVRYPDVLTPVEAAVHYNPLLTVYTALMHQARLQPGEWVLITDASRCCGPASIQLAKALGARVIASTHDAGDRDYLRELGAERVIAAEEEDLVSRIASITDGVGVHVALDALGGPQLALLGEAMAPRGRLLLYGLNGGNQTPLPACAAFKKKFKLYIHCVQDFTGQPEMGLEADCTAVREALQHIDQLTRDRLLKAQIKQVFPFEQFVEAHRCMEQCPTRGRVVLSVE